LGGPSARVERGDMIELNTITGELNALVEPDIWNARKVTAPDLCDNDDTGRLLFTGFRAHVSTAETGAISAFSNAG